jgi:hypothetical protein
MKRTCSGEEPAGEARMKGGTEEPPEDDGGLLLPDRPSTRFGPPPLLLLLLLLLPEEEEEEEAPLARTSGPSVFLTRSCCVSRLFTSVVSTHQNN